MTGTAPLALVTGGHRRLGARISAALARAGYCLAIHGSHDVSLDGDLASALSDQNTVWHGFVADFEDSTSVEPLLEQVSVQFGRAPDLLVNSAAIFGQDTLETVTADALTKHYAVNAMAPVLLTKAFAELSGGRGGAIINILDQRLTNPHGDQLAYTLAKQALAGFTQIAARELAGRGILVNAVAPGLTIATDDYDDPQMQRIAAMMPLGHLPQSSDIADAVLYLARAKAVTGQVIAVDSGAHMRSYTRDFMHL